MDTLFFPGLVVGVIVGFFLFCLVGIFVVDPAQHKYVIEREEISQCIGYGKAQPTPVVTEWTSTGCWAIGFNNKFLLYKR